MLAYIDAYLVEWAQWSMASSEAMGFAHASPEYRMMTSNAATTSKKKHRRKRHLINVGKRFVERNVDPMRCVESRGKKVVRTEDNPIAEAMDKAIAALRQPRQRDALKMRYKAGFNDTTCAGVFGVSRKTFSTMVSKIHEALDMYLRINHPEIVPPENHSVVELKSQGLSDDERRRLVGVLESG